MDLKNVILISKKYSSGCGHEGISKFEKIADFLRLKHQERTI